MHGTHTHTHLREALVERAEERLMWIAGTQVPYELEVGDGRRIEEHHAVGGEELDGEGPLHEGGLWWW